MGGIFHKKNLNSSSSDYEDLIGKSSYVKVACVKFLCSQVAEGAEDG